MSIIELKISSRVYNCDLKFERRLSIIRGDSGTGKSTLAELTSQQVNGVLIKSTYPISVVTETTWETLISGSTDRILIFDDLDIVETARFADMYVKYAVLNNLYFIVIAREDVSLVSTGRLSYSTNSIYKMIKDGNTHYLERYYTYGESESQYSYLLNLHR